MCDSSTSRPLLPALLRISASLLLLCSIVPASAHAEELQSKVSLKKGRPLIRIIYPPGQEEWAQWVLEQTLLFLPAAERFLGKPFPYRDYLRITRCEDCIASANGREIVLSYPESKPGEPSLIFHELGHVWFGYTRNSTCQEWFSEGVVSYLPAVMREAGFLPDTHQYHEGLNRYWGLYWPFEPRESDSSLCSFPRKTLSYRYSKAYKLAHLMYLSLGAAKYKRLLRSWLANPTRSNKDLVAKLKSISKRNWNSFITGWVTGSKYRYIDPASLQMDSDSDGLTDGEELALKTDPRLGDTDSDFLPDGAEVALKTNPRRADGDGLSRLLSSPPFIDGGISDWTARGITPATDQSDDSGGAAWADMREMRYLVVDDMLYVQVGFAARPEQQTGIFFDVLIDTNADGLTDEEFSFYLNTPRNPWHYDSTSKTSDYPAGLASAAGDSIELAIPLSAIPASQFRILPIVRDEGAQLNLDEWPEWVDVVF